MLKIRRRTTPTIIINVPEDISLNTVEALFVTISQRDKVVIDRSINTVTIVDQKISLDLTQEETLKLNANTTADIQLAFKLSSGKAFGSQIESIKILDVLKEGVI